MDTAQALGELRNRFLSYGGDRPILALALRWLEANIPPPVTPRCWSTAISGSAT
jgi:aminoglycoside phosphotransferase (APT) family kinase protein